MGTRPTSKPWFSSQRVPASLSDLVAGSTSRRSGAAGPLPVASLCLWHITCTPYPHPHRHVDKTPRQRAGFVSRQTGLHCSRTAAPISTKIGLHLRLLKAFDLLPSATRYAVRFGYGALRNAEGCFRLPNSLVSFVAPYLANRPANQTEILQAASSSRWL